ncbi:MAG TPA: hypothetical protein VGM88_24610 [Kofleriaceae bacterium]|jgi:hypothetical protein
MSSPQPPLVALRIPGGWSVVINGMLELEPAELEANDPRVRMLSADMLHVRQPATRLAIDVGWRVAERAFVGAVIVDDEFATPLVRHVAPSLREIVAWIEATLLAPPPIPTERLLARLEDYEAEIRGGAAIELAARGEVGALGAVKDAFMRERDPAAIDQLHRAQRWLVQENERRKRSGGV